MSNKIQTHVLNAFEYFIEHLPQFKIQVSGNVITLLAPNLKSYDVFVMFDGVFTSFIVDGIDFLTFVKAMLYVANDSKEDIFFGNSSVVDDVNALLPPFSENPFRFYRVKNTRSKAVVFYSPKNQIKMIDGFNYSQCLEAIELNKKLSLDSNVLKKIMQRFNYYNATHFVNHQQELI